MTSDPEGAPPAPPEIVPPPVQIASVAVVRWGMALWLAVLVALLAVPGWGEGDRSWWVWVPVAGLAVGALGWAYMARGRDNAEDA